MAFRVRKTLFGRCILQVRADGQWIDMRPNDRLLDSFTIVTNDFMDEHAQMPHKLAAQLQSLRERVAVYERRAATARRARARKRVLPVLTDAIPSPLKVAAERAAIESSEFSNTQPGVHP